MHVERDIVLVSPSVRPSVCPSHCGIVSQSLSTILCGMIPDFLSATAVTKIQGELPLNTWDAKKLRFLTEIAVCLGNCRRFVHGYYGSLIGSHR